MRQLRFQNKVLLTLTTTTLPCHETPPALLGPLLTLLLVEAGEGTLSIGRSLYQMTSGDLFVVNTVEPARILSITSPQLTYTRLCFDSAYIASTTNKSALDYHYLEMFYSRRHVATHKVSAQYGGSAALKQLFGRLRALLDDPPEDGVYEAKILLLQLLLGILRYYERDEELNPDGALYSSGNETIESVLRFIEENLSQTLTLPMFAEIAHMNPFYFSTFFKKHISVSPMQYVLRARISRAVGLLRETDKTILDIALLCGFNSTANFNKAFKKITGKTPSDFRSS